MKTPQVTDLIDARIIGNEPTYLPERKAYALAAQLQAEEDDGWRYRVLHFPRGAVVSVSDDIGGLLGYL
jgi:hypothetical protein